ncbi:uncharacterized protein LOC131858879 [Cryptomeria japonica]|uniref:uncharacterized protein LOC131858879 n=1 Tax=Cryptomeria japonica TaxID=3369 RepID=UPI0027DA1E5B|nr:uncharacterized protein LOC131858879 [Cryptomeria japonica]
MKFLAEKPMESLDDNVLYVSRKNVEWQNSIIKQSHEESRRLLKELVDLIDTMQKDLKCIDIQLMKEDAQTIEAVADMENFFKEIKFIRETKFLTTNDFSKVARIESIFTVCSDHLEEEEIEDKIDLEGESISALEELKNVRREYKCYKKSVQEKCDQLSKCLEESNKNISTLTTQLEEAKGMCEGVKSDFDAKKRRGEELEIEVETKGKECQRLEDEVEILREELEKCQEELKMRIKYGNSIEALDKMFRNEKHSKDTEGVGYDFGQFSTSKDTSKKEIHFVFK